MDVLKLKSLLEEYFLLIIDVWFSLGLIRLVMLFFDKMVWVWDVDSVSGYMIYLFVCVG